MEGSVVWCGTHSRLRRGWARTPPPSPFSAPRMDVAARGRRLHHALDPQLVGRRAQRNVALAGLLADLAVRALDDLPQPLVYLVLLPAEVLEVLDPLEVGDDDPARVGHHVGDDVDAIIGQDVVGRRRGRAVCALYDDPAGEPVGVLLVDHPAQRGRDEDLARRLE